MITFIMLNLRYLCFVNIFSNKKKVKILFKISYLAPDIRFKIEASHWLFHDHLS